MENYRQAMNGDVSSSSVVANPVDAYHLVKLLTIDWDVVERVLDTESNSSRSKSLFESLFSILLLKRFSLLCFIAFNEQNILQIQFF